MISYDEDFPGKTINDESFSSPCRMPRAPLSVLLYLHSASVRLLLANVSGA